MLKNNIKITQNIQNNYCEISFKNICFLCVLRFFCFCSKGKIPAYHGKTLLHTLAISSSKTFVCVKDTRIILLNTSNFVTCCELGSGFIHNAWYNIIHFP